MWRGGSCTVQRSPFHACLLNMQETTGSLCVVPAFQALCLREGGREGGLCVRVARWCRRVAPVSGDRQHGIPCCGRCRVGVGSCGCVSSCGTAARAEQPGESHHTVRGFGRTGRVSLTGGAFRRIGQLPAQMVVDSVTSPAEPSSARKGREGARSESAPSDPGLD